MSPPGELRCALCEEPVAQGVRCAGCEAPHHTRCFHGKGERCTVCRSQAAPIPFEAARDTWTLPSRAGAARSVLTAIVRLVAALGFGWLIWTRLTQVFDPLRRTSFEEIFAGCWSISHTAIIPTAKDEWHELRLPPGVRVGHVVLQVRTRGVECQKSLPTLVVETDAPSRDGAARPWKLASKNTLMPACQSDYRVAIPVGATRCRLAARPHGAQVDLMGGAAFISAAPAGSVTDIRKIVRVEEVQSGQLVVSWNGERATVPELMVCENRRAAVAVLQDPESGALAMLYPDGLVSLRTALGDFSLQGPVTHRRGALRLPLIADPGMAWFRNVAAWRLAKAWRQCVVEDWECDEAGRQVFVLLDDGRAARCDDQHSPGFCELDELNAGKAGGTARDTAVSRFTSRVGTRRPIQVGDELSLEPVLSGTTWVRTFYSVGELGSGPVPVRGLQASALPRPFLPLKKIGSELAIRLVPAAKRWPTKLGSAHYGQFVHIHEERPGSRRASSRPYLGDMVSGEPTLQRTAWGMSESKLVARQGRGGVAAKDTKDGTRRITYRISIHARPWLTTFVLRKDGLFAADLEGERVPVPGGPLAEWRYLLEELGKSYGAPDRVVKRFRSRKAKDEPLEKAYAEGGVLLQSFWRVGDVRMVLQLDSGAQPRITMVHEGWDRNLLR
jgi:hypothetical protein